MNDPWDVKSVRQPGQYLSCMKINGVPLLPPILSKGCRKEMQYYKLLAKEVEKRIAHLKQYVYDNSSDSEDKTDAPELPECEQSYDLAEEEIQSGFNVNIGSVKAVTNTEQSAEITPRGKDISKIANRGSSPAPKFFIDLNLTINETGTKILSTAQKAESPPGLEVPERDYNCVSRFTQQVITEKEVVTTVETCRNIEKKNIENNFDFCDKKDGSLSDPITEIPLSPDGPSSLSSKRFTGSLDNLHREITKDSLKNNSQLVRQRSYTLLYPSPQLLAHLEIHSQNTGIEMSSISMSESLSNMSSPGKKRRSWDLESAKVKWSNMALELKQKSVANVINTVAKNIPKPEPKQNISLRAKSVDPAVARRNNPITRVLPKSEPITKNKSVSVTRNHVNSRSLDQQPAASSLKTKVEHSLKNPTTPVSEVADPATRVRELYEKIQKQQLVQMENLVEKQKKEQLLLQQVFEEQNNMLFKQLKTICPKSPIEAKEAWSDKQCEGDRGPVSLSQLINYKSSTLTDTNSYLNHCDNVLKKSRNITGSLKKVQATSNGKNGTKIQSPTKQSDGSRTRTHSPAKNPTSRRLNYDTSASSDRDYEPMLTDRTNDTMADLNVTFPSDNSDEGNYNNNVVNQLCSKITKPSNGSSVHTNSVIHSRVTEKTIKNVGRSVNSSMQNSSTRTSKLTSYKHVPNPRELEAATKIVAHAKGYLVRRLMRTERVQGIVQTIKDALLCALQLHQDREGIRGADVDLHRRLIQQITAACYSLHDTFVASTAAERCAMIAADRGRRHSLAARQPMSFRQTDIMTQSHSGSFPARTKRQPSSLMTQSNYETFSGEKSSPVSRRYVASPRRRPWR